MTVTLSNTCQALLICCRDMGAEGVAVDGSNLDLASALVELGFAQLSFLPGKEGVRLKLLDAGASYLKSERVNS